MLIINVDAYLLNDLVSSKVVLVKEDLLDLIARLESVDQSGVCVFGLSLDVRKPMLGKGQAFLSETLLTSFCLEHKGISYLLCPLVKGHLGPQFITRLLQELFHESIV